MILSAEILSCRSRRREDDRGHGANRASESPGIRQHGVHPGTWLPTRVITRPRRSHDDLRPKRPRIAPTSPSRDSQLARHASGPTSHRNNATRSMPTVDGLAADVVSDCNDCAASASSDHLLMCGRPAEHGGHGSAASQKLLGNLRYVIDAYAGPQLGTPDARNAIPEWGRREDLQRGGGGALAAAFVRHTQLALIAVRRS